MLPNASISSSAGGEYEKALEITLLEVERDESGGARKIGAQPMVPWYYWGRRDLPEAKAVQ